MEDIQELLWDLNITPVVRDERCHGQPLNLTFQGTLRPEQKVAADSMLKHETGVLAATTAFGKTVVAAWLIAQRGANTLVLVHRRQLLDQWVDRLSTFLDINNREIGRVGGGRRKPTGRLDVAAIQSLVRKGVVEDYVGEYGHVIVDECHHLSAHSFEQVVRRAKAQFVTGLSATVTRKDGHHPIIFMQCGLVRHRVSARAEAIRRPFTHAVLVRPTAFQPTMPADVLLPSDPEWKRDYAATVRRLIRDGVDAPLANLFVNAIRPSSPEVTGLARARSASEAFLYVWIFRSAIEKAGGWSQ